MFENYEDVIDLIKDINESKFDCSEFTSVTVYTTWGIYDLYPKNDAETADSLEISYSDLLTVLSIFVPENERAVPHNIRTKKDTQVIYGDEDSPVCIIINKFPDKTETAIFVQFTFEGDDESLEQDDFFEIYEDEDEDDVWSQIYRQTSDIRRLIAKLIENDVPVPGDILDRYVIRSPDKS